MSRFLKTGAFAAAAAALLSGAVQASTVSPPPASLERNVVEGDDAKLYAEKTSVDLQQDVVTVDFLVGTNLSVGDTKAGISNFQSGVGLAEGSYNSFLIHFDPDGGKSTQGTFTFHHKIVAIILSNGTGNSSTTSPDGLLNKSDAFFGAMGTAYETHVGRRAEGGNNDPNSDQFTLDSHTQISYKLKTNSEHIDNIRVITEVAPVPVPAAGLLLLGAFGGLLAMRRRTA